MKVLIPSINGRFDSLLNLLNWLVLQVGIDNSDVFVFVISTQRHLYRKHVIDKLAFEVQLVTGVYGLGRQRNFMYQYCLRHFAPGEHVLALDDDVAGFSRVRGIRQYSWGSVPREKIALTGPQIRRFLSKAFADCIRLGSYLWGLNTSDNAMCMSLPGAPPRQSLGLVCGFTYGFRLIDDPQLMLRNTLQNGVLEDFERSLRYFQRHGLILRYGTHCTTFFERTSTLTAMLASKHNRSSASDAAAHRLVAAFPEYTRLSIGAHHSLYLRSLKSGTPSAPSCGCGACCLCASRDGACSLRQAKDSHPVRWCRSCRLEQSWRCTRTRCQNRPPCRGL